jgi:hypothetical protein
MSISVSKQYLQIAKRNLSNFNEISVISFWIEILRHLNALSTPFYTPNVLHVDFIVETIHADRKTQSFKFQRNFCHFVPDWDTTAFKRSIHSILHAERIACRYQCGNSLQIAKRSLSNFYEISVISFCIEILRRSYALSTVLYTPNVVHVDFSVETIPANRKTQSFKILRNLCHLVPDWDTKAFKRSLHSILHAESIACRLQRRNNHCKSQKAISQISMKSLSFSHWMRYYGI